MGCQRIRVGLVVAMVGACGVPVRPPVQPLGAPVVVDGTPGVQGYVGGRINAGLGLSEVPTGGTDAAMRAQVHDHVAVDVIGSWEALGHASVSPGLWVSSRSNGDRRERVGFGMRVAPVVGFGDLQGRTRYRAVSAGLDLRPQMTVRYAPWGAFHFTWQYGFLKFVNVQPTGISAVHTVAFTFGADIPVGNAAIVLTAGPLFVGDRENLIMAGGHLQLGIRFGKGADDMSTPRARRDEEVH